MPIAIAAAGSEYDYKPDHCPTSSISATLCAALSYCPAATLQHRAFDRCRTKPALNMRVAASRSPSPTSVPQFASPMVTGNIREHSPVCADLARMTRAYAAILPPVAGKQSQPATYATSQDWGCPARALLAWSFHGVPTPHTRRG